MALMIPEICNGRCNSNVTKGEREIFNLLKLNLSDDYTVYFDTSIEGKYPDFVIVGKDIGIVVLEIKDYGISTISQPPSGDGNLVIRVDEIDENGNTVKVEKKVNPYKQAREYANTIKNKLCLRFKFNFNSIVIFPYLKEEDLANKYDGYSDCIPKERTIYKEDLDCLYDKTESLEELIKLKCGHLYYKLSDENVKEINRYIYPLSKPNLKRLEENIDKEIEEKLVSFKSGKYVLQGVSGSGKTIYLTKLAKLRLEIIEQHGFSEKVLITAYNNTLISFFKAYFKNYKYIDIKTKYELMHQRNKNDKYGLILVDEGQDFSLDELEYIINNYSDKQEKKYFMIAMDGAQNIYEQENFRLDELGDDIQIYKLNKNYRNNKSIFEFANIFLHCNSNSKIDKYKLGDSNYIIDDYESLKEDKGSVFLIKYDDFQDKMEQIKVQIEYYISRGIKEKEICIMYVGSKPKTSGLNWEYFNDSIKNYLSENQISYYDFYTNKKSFKAELVDESINVSTIHSSKGFEYKVVILCGLEENYFKTSNNLKKLVYTAMTRAKEKLVIFISEKNDITKTLEKTYNFIYQDENICINCKTKLNKFDRFCHNCSEEYSFNIDIPNYLKCKKCNSYNELHNLYCRICSNKL